MRQWTSLVALVLLLLFAGAADGLMDTLGPVGFLSVGLVVMGAAWRLTENDFWEERSLAEPYEEEYDKEEETYVSKDHSV